MFPAALAYQAEAGFGKVSGVIRRLSPDDFPLLRGARRAPCGRVGPTQSAAMTRTDEELSWLAIARMEEERQAVGVAEISREAIPLGGGWLCFGGPGSWQNQAVGLGLHGPVGVEEVAALARFYDARGVEPEVIVCPFADESYVAALSAAGFRATGFENVLFRSLGPDVDELRAAAEILVREVRADDAEDVTCWVEASTCGFRPANEPVPPSLDESTRHMLDHPRCAGLVAELDGQIVGGAAIEVIAPAASTPGLAALMATSVLPHARRRGVQRALMVERLRRARAAGCAIATIQSKPGIPTERNARRLGFEMAYTRVVLQRA